MEAKDRDLYAYCNVPNPAHKGNPLLTPPGHPVRALFRRETLEREAMQQHILIQKAVGYIHNRQQAKAIGIAVVGLDGVAVTGMLLPTLSEAPTSYNTIYLPIIAGTGLLLAAGAAWISRHLACRADQKLNETVSRFMMDHNKNLDLTAMTTEIFDRNVRHLPRQLQGPLRRFGRQIDSVLGLPPFNCNPPQP